MDHTLNVAVIHPVPSFFYSHTLEWSTYEASSGIPSREKNQPPEAATWRTSGGRYRRSGVRVQIQLTKVGGVGGEPNARCVVVGVKKRTLAGKSPCVSCVTLQEECSKVFSHCQTRDEGNGKLANIMGGSSHDGGWVPTPFSSKSLSF